MAEAKGPLEPAPEPDAEEMLGKGGNENGMAVDEGREGAAEEASLVPEEGIQEDGEVGSPETTAGGSHQCEKPLSTEEGETETPPASAPQPDGGLSRTPAGEAGSPEATESEGDETSPNTEDAEESRGSPAAAREEPDEPGTAAGQSLEEASRESCSEEEVEGGGAPDQPDGGEGEAGDGGRPPEAEETSEGACDHDEPQPAVEAAGPREEPGEESAAAMGWQEESAEVVPPEEPPRAESPPSPARAGEAAQEEAGAADGPDARGEGQAAEEAGVEGSVAGAEVDGEPASPQAAEPPTEGEHSEPLEEPAEGEAARAAGVNGLQGGEEAEAALPGGLPSLAAAGGEKQEHEISLFVKVRHVRPVGRLARMIVVRWAAGVESLGSSRPKNSRQLLQNKSSLLHDDHHGLRTPWSRCAGEGQEPSSSLLPSLGVQPGSLQCARQS